MTATSRIRPRLRARTSARREPRATSRGRCRGPRRGCRTSTSGSPVGRNHLIDLEGRARARRRRTHTASTRMPMRTSSAGHLLDEVHDREVGAVEQDEGARRRGSPSPGRRTARSRRRSEVTVPDVGELDLLGGRHAELGVGAAGRHVDLAAHGAPLADDLLLGRCPGGSGSWPSPGGERVVELGRRADAAHRLDVAGATSGRVISGIRRPRRRVLGHEAGEVVDVALALVGPRGARPACRCAWRRSSRRRPRGASAVSAPSGWISAQANGSVERVLVVRARCTHAHVVTVAARADLDQLGEVLAGHRVVLGGRHDHPAVGCP